MNASILNGCAGGRAPCSGCLATIPENQEMNFCIECGLELEISNIEAVSRYSPNICFTCHKYDKTKRFMQLINLYTATGSHFIPHCIFNTISNYASFIKQPISYRMINNIISFTFFKKFKPYVPYIFYIYTNERLISLSDGDIDALRNKFDRFQIEFFRLRLRSNSLNNNYLLYQFLYSLGYRTELNYIKRLKPERLALHNKLYKQVCLSLGWIFKPVL